jgi:hypothetical protein
MDPLDWLLRLALPVTMAAVFGAALVVGWTTEPNKLVIGFAPKQPIAFSHKVHAGDNKIPCEYCHTSPTRSPVAGIPAVETCMNCHRVAKPGTDAIRELTAVYEQGQALKWKRVHRLPDYVYFDHRPHVNAGLDCAVCHGAVSEMEVLGQRMSMRMGNCLSCHRSVQDYIAAPAYKAPLDPALKGPDNCFACHR